MARMHVHRHDGLLELSIRRAGLRTRATVLRDGVPVAEQTGFVRVLVPLPGPAAERDDARAATVLVLAPAPGIASRAMLLVQRPGGTEDDPVDELAREAAVELPAALAKVATLARAERIPFEPAPGTLAARLQRFQREHPRLWATRHVVLATGRVLAALLGVLVFLQVIVRQVLGWLADRLPDVDLPSIPWPEVDLPSIPWPDVDLPDVSLPGWLLVLIGTAKFWVPILVAVVLAVREVRRRKAQPGDAGTDDCGGGDPPDAHRRP